MTDKAPDPVPERWHSAGAAVVTAVIIGCLAGNTLIMLSALLPGDSEVLRIPGEAILYATFSVALAMLAVLALLLVVGIAHLRWSAILALCAALAATGLGFF